MKKIYFASALTHASPEFRQSIADIKRRLAHKFEMLDYYGVDRDGDARAVYLHDSENIKACDLLIAECSYPSHGVGIEIGLALQMSKPVLAVALADAKVSRMLMGIDNALFTFKRYKDMKELEKILQDIK